jgi:translation elongation factor EF-Tu-like GTPase
MLLTNSRLITVHRNCIVLTESEGGRKSPFFTDYKPAVYLITNLVIYENC